MDSFSVTAHITVDDEWEPDHSDETERDTLLVDLVDRHRQAVLLTFSKMSVERAWHVGLFWVSAPKGAAPDEAEMRKAAATLRGFNEHASEPISWQVVTSFRFPESVRSVIPLPVPVEDDWATDIRGMRFVKRVDDEELYSVIVDRPGRALTHQVGFVRPERVTPASARRWLKEALDVSETFVVRGGEAGDAVN
jgi:hypothetical protein